MSLGLYTEVLVPCPSLALGISDKSPKPPQNCRIRDLVGEGFYLSVLSLLPSLSPQDFPDTFCIFK